VLWRPENCCREQASNALLQRQLHQYCLVPGIACINAHTHEATIATASRQARGHEVTRSDNSTKRADRPLLFSTRMRTTESNTNRSGTLMVVIVTTAMIVIGMVG
jgi:hypothetical protein